MYLKHEMPQMQLESFCDNCFLDAALSFDVASTIVVSTFFNLAISFPHFSLQLHFTMETHESQPISWKTITSKNIVNDGQV